MTTEATTLLSEASTAAAGTAGAAATGSTTQATGTEAGAAGAAAGGTTTGQTGAGKDAGATGAPAQYADFKLPDGVKLEGTELTEITTLAKDFNLTQDQAQKLVDRDVATRQAADASIKAQVATVHQKWRDESTANAEWGGTNLGANLGLAKKALTTFDKDGALAKGLEDTGAGNNPAMIGFLVRVGKAISEDKLVTGGAPAGEQSLAKRMYPNMA